VAGAVDAYVVTVHGVGTQSSDFSASAQKRLRDAGAERGVSVHSAAAHWAPIADRVEAKFLSPGLVREDAAAVRDHHGG
jgi:hypothetical protein